MRLADLSPKWLSSAGRVGGVGFLCPHCLEQRLHVYFDPAVGTPVWTRSGDTFETLTVNPSVDYRSSGHWHGQIIRGAIVTTPDSPPPRRR